MIRKVERLLRRIAAMQIGPMRNARTAAAAAQAWFRTDPRMTRAPRRTPHAPDPACPHCRAAPAGARPLAQSLDGLLADGAPAISAARISDAARAFAEGNGFLPGLLVDRWA
jgi:hypothetical protein